MGPRRRWRNVVTGIRFEAMLKQNRDATPDDDIGKAKVESFHAAIERELTRLKARIRDQMTFTLQSPDFDHAYESTKMEVGEFVYRTRRIDALLQNIAELFNSQTGQNLHNLTKNYLNIQDDTSSSTSTKDDIPANHQQSIKEYYVP